MFFWLALRRSRKRRARTSTAAVGRLEKDPVASFCAEYLQGTRNSRRDHLVAHLSLVFAMRCGYKLFRLLTEHRYQPERHPGAKRPGCGRNPTWWLTRSDCGATCSPCSPRPANCRTTAASWCSSSGEGWGIGVEVGSFPGASLQLIQ